MEQMMSWVFEIGLRLHCLWDVLWMPGERLLEVRDEIAHLRSGKVAWHWTYGVDEGVNTGDRVAVYSFDARSPSEDGEGVNGLR